MLRQVDVGKRPAPTVAKAWVDAHAAQIDAWTR
jgi:ABC-type proline/glycine betaine transport system substrate-binding protein